MKILFDKPEIDAARAEWGCNCGPAALAMAAQVPLYAVRNAIPGFAAKRFTNVLGMKAGLEILGRKYTSVPVGRKIPRDIDGMFDDRPAVVRIQFTGPWMKAGVNPKWAYTHTHWVCSWDERSVSLIFDVNCGVTSLGEWEDGTAREIANQHPQRDGGWVPTHIFRLDRA